MELSVYMWYSMKLNNAKLGFPNLQIEIIIIMRDYSLKSIFKWFQIFTQIVWSGLAWNSNYAFLNALN